MANRYERDAKAEALRIADRKRHSIKRGLTNPLDRPKRVAVVTLPSISFLRDLRVRDGKK